MGSLLSGCSSTPKKAVKISRPTTHFNKISFSELNDWDKDHHEEPFTTFVKSCNKIVKKKDDYNKVGSDLKQWKKVCTVAIELSKRHFQRELKGSNLLKARLMSKHFFESYFTPYRVSMSNHGRDMTDKSRFTGYYEMELQGSKKQSRAFPYPVYGRPKNLKELRGSHILKRASINNGSLKGKGLEIAWVNDMPRLYFMHIQGSGVIRLKEGGEIALVSNGHNGHSFKALPSCYTGTTLNVIKQLHANGKKGHQDMNCNHSYMFFKTRPEHNAVGAQNVQLTPERSAAIDSRIYPYGVPIWIDTRIPFIKDYANGEKYGRLIMAQDRGGAIKGGGRLDLFWGRGRRAEHIASGFNVLGGMYVLYPKTVRLAQSFDL